MKEPTKDTSFSGATRNGNSGKPPISANTHPKDKGKKKLGPRQMAYLFGAVCFVIVIIVWSSALSSVKRSKREGIATADGLGISANSPETAAIAAAQSKERVEKIMTSHTSAIEAGITRLESKAPVIMNNLMDAVNNLPASPSLVRINHKWHCPRSRREITYEKKAQAGWKALLLDRIEAVYDPEIESVLSITEVPPSVTIGFKQC